MLVLIWDWQRLSSPSNTANRVFVFCHLNIVDIIIIFFFFLNQNGHVRIHLDAWLPIF